MNFVHLHNHTHYSLLDGLTKIDELVKRAKEQGSPAVAITDHGNMYGVIEFYQTCKKEGIKPIIGSEVYLAKNSRFDKATRDDARSYHLVLLAKNDIGYHNLIKLVSKGHLEGFYYKPRIDWELLKEHSEGLIATSACLGGEISNLILSDKLDRAKERILEYNELFGQGNYYLEIQDHPSLPGQADVNRELIKFSKELNIPLVATNDVHYLNKDDDEAQDILLCLQNKKKKTDTDRMSMLGEDYSMRSNREMIESFKDVPEAIENTVKIAEMCNVEIKLGDIQLPYFEVPKEYNENSYFRKLCEDGLERRYGKKYDDVDREIKERMDYELGVIEKMGWPAYFLIVSDFVNWAKDNKIVVGPGRGSAAGSLVCFLVGITNLDPLKYDLIFERFLNPERISMPDIDMDFADARREEVIQYVSEKYGHDKVSQIITFGTMAARAAIRDVGRVLDVPYEFCDKLSKMIPMFTKLGEAIEKVPELKEIYQKDPQAKQILHYALRLEGVSRHTSTHACGVLITKKPLEEYTPLQYVSSSDRNIVSQYSLHPVEDLGLLKMDFLGLKNLTIIESALKIIKNTRGETIDMENIPLDDKAAYELFQQGNTTGVFQFESSGMKRYLKELKPTEFEDIIAMVALYRPGPMEWIPDYIKGKKGEKVKYLHPKLEHILDKTYGVAIYQEQVMQIARDLAGFTMGEADVLRKAMGKKIHELLVKQKEKFIEGCVKNNIHSELAEKVFSFIEPFAGYGFNRSHAACYALIGYQTAYLKAHWPVEFMAALLTADQHNVERIAVEIEECRKMGINVMPPDINESFASFTVVTSGTMVNALAKKDEKVKTIRFGLNAIKNIGENIIDVVIAERKKNGSYKDIYDFLERNTDKDLNKKSLESLIKCGGLDSYGDRSYFLYNLELLLKINKEFTQAKLSGQNSLFNLESTPALKPKLNDLPPEKEISQAEKLSWEKDLLGLYISEHPFNEFKNKLSTSVKRISDLKKYIDKENIMTSGVVSSVKKIITKNNKSMLFVKIEDAVSNVEVLVFPRMLEKTHDLWREGKVVLCQGKVSNKDQEIKFLADVAMEIKLESFSKNWETFRDAAAIAGKRRNMFIKKGFVKKNEADGSKEKEEKKNEPVEQIFEQPFKIIINEQLDPDGVANLMEVLKSFPGNSEVYILDHPNDKIIKTNFKVKKSAILNIRIKEEFSNKIKVVDMQ